MTEKLEHLKSILRSYERVIIAFSGGIDSAFLFKVAHDVLGKDNVKGVTAKSPSLAARELEEAAGFAQIHGMNHEIIETEEFQNPNYVKNPENRCYHCKDELYTKLFQIAKTQHFKHVCSGTNLDDLNDTRPGLIAAKEHEVKNPLVDAKLSKQEIRELSRELGIESWQKPASPCLSSRVPHGEEVTPEKLRQIESGENFMKDLGFKIVRLRHFGKRARIELGPEEFIALMDADLRQKITAFVLSLGFKVVVFESYQQGSLNKEKINA